MNGKCGPPWQTIFLPFWCEKLWIWKLFGMTNTNKVETILKDSLDLIQSPSMEIQVIFAWGVRAKHSWARCQLTSESKKFVDMQCFGLLPQVDFAANDLNFHWRWRWLDQIQAIFLNLFYFISLKSLKWLKNFSGLWSCPSATMIFFDDDNPKVFFVFSYIHIWLLVFFLILGSWKDWHWLIKVILEYIW